MITWMQTLSERVSHRRIAAFTGSVYEPHLKGHDEGQRPGSIRPVSISTGLPGVHTMNP